METVDSLRDSLRTYNGQLKSAQDELMKLNAQLAQGKKGKEKRGTKQAIKNYEEQIKRLQKLIKDTNNDIVRLEKSQDKFDAKTTAYEHGIDPNKAWADAIASGIGSIGSTVSSFAGGDVMKAFDDKKPKPIDVVPTVPGGQQPKKDNMMLYIGIAVVAILMLKKK